MKTKSSYKKANGIQRIDRDACSIHAENVSQEEFDHYAKNWNKSAWHWYIGVQGDEAAFARWVGLPRQREVECRVVEFRCGRQRMAFRIGSIVRMETIVWPQYPDYEGRPEYMCELAEPVALVGGKAKRERAAA